MRGLHKSFIVYLVNDTLPNGPNFPRGKARPTCDVPIETHTQCRDVEGAAQREEELLPQRCSQEER